MKKLISAIFIVCVFGIVLYWASGGFAGKTIEVRLTQPEIDALLAKKFPLEKKHHKLVRVTYHNPSLIVVPGTTQINIGIQAMIRIGISPLEVSYPASATLLSEIAYDASSKKLLLRQPRCEQLDLPAIPEKHRDLAVQALNLTTATIWDEIPIYELKSHRRIQAAARMVLKKVHIDDRTVVFTLGLPEESAARP